MAGSKKRKHKVYGLGDMFTARTCGECEKEFIIPDAGTYAYKDYKGNRLKYFCSWKCLQAFRKEKGKK